MATIIQTTRRQFPTFLGAMAGVAALSPTTLARAQAKPPSSAIARYVYVGTYTIGIPPGAPTRPMMHGAPVFAPYANSREH
jgi:hypothetical protein